MPSDLNKLSIKELSERLRGKDFSAVELTDYFLARVRAQDGEINAFLSVTEELARRQAEEADKRIAREAENVSLLCGIPFGIKDNILVEGEIATGGSKILENYRASFDAEAVGKLKKAGAIIIGKTNMDEFAMGSSTENSAFGPTKNPLDLERVPGGSSGGSAAAVAAGMCPAALGSDTGGSVRQPAAFCGLVGLKPTYGAVSRSGLMAMSSSLDQIGVFTRSVSDAALIFEAISGGDEKDATSKKNYFFKFGDIEKTDLKKLKIGVLEEFFGSGLNEEVGKKTREGIDALAVLGAEIKEVSLPSAEWALSAYYIIMPAEVSTNLSRYDGIRYGRFEEARDITDSYFETRRNFLGAETKRRIILGTYVLSVGYYDAYYLRAQKARRMIADDFNKIFKEVDVIITPTTPTPAFKIGEKTDNPLEMYRSDIYTVPVNLAGLPAVSVPCGTVDGLPVGMQIIGPRFRDDLVLGVGRRYEEARNF